MSWFYSVKIFRLEVYDREIGERIKRAEDGFSSFTIDDHRLTKLISQESINAEWLALSKWLWDDDGRKDSLYRAIRPIDFYTFLKYGTDRALLKGYDDTGERPGPFEKRGLTKPEVLWADASIPKAWEYATKTNPSIIAVYDARCFERSGIGDYGVYAFIRKDKSIDFKDTVKAIITLRYRH